MEMVRGLMSSDDESLVTPELLSGRADQRGRRRELILRLGHQRLEIHADTGAGEPQGASETGEIGHYEM